MSDAKSKLKLSLNLRARAGSAPPVLTPGPQSSPKQPENAIRPVVKEESEKFQRIPIKKPNKRKQNVLGLKKRKMYKEDGPPGGRNAQWMTTQSLQAFGRKVYEEVCDVRQLSSSESVDAVTNVARLPINRLSPRPAVQDQEGLTNEQQRQVAEAFEQIGELADQLEADVTREVRKLEDLRPDQQRRILVSVGGMLNSCQGREVFDPEVKALLSDIHQIAHEDGAIPSFDIASDRFNSMMDTAIQLAELKHLQDILRDPSFDANDSFSKKFLVRWPLNFIIPFLTVGMPVILWTVVRGLTGNFIKSGFPDIAAVTGMNATENWNVTDSGDPHIWNSMFPGNSTLPPQHQGGTAWGAATAMIVMIPQLFNLRALVRDGRDGTAQGHVQVSRLTQFALCVTALGIGFSMPAPVGQGFAAAWTVNTFADVLKGVLYSYGRDTFNYFYPKPRSNASTLTPKAVGHDALVYLGTQTLLGIAFGYFAAIKTNVALYLPFFGSDLAGGDLGALGLGAVANGGVEAADEGTLGYFMRDEDKKKFMKNLIEQNEEGVREINKRKEEFIKHKLPKILGRREDLVDLYENDDSDKWVTDLKKLTQEELAELTEGWEKEARLYVKEHLEGLVIKFPTWEQTKAKVTDGKRLIDFMFNGRLTTNRAAAMATAFFFQSTVLEAMARPEDPFFDRTLQAVAAAVLIVAVYVPGILACNQRDAEEKPADMTNWQAFKYFMGFLTKKDFEKEREGAKLISVDSEDGSDDDRSASSLPNPPAPTVIPLPPDSNLDQQQSVFDPPPPDTIPESPRSRSRSL